MLRVNDQDCRGVVHRLNELGQSLVDFGSVQVDLPRLSQLAFRLLLLNLALLGLVVSCGDDFRQLLLVALVLKFVRADF